MDDGSPNERSAGPDREPSASGRKIFVSYARADQRYVARLVKVLASIGYSVGYDHTTIRHGESFPAEIAKALGSSDLVLAVLTDAAIESEWVGRELAYAQDLAVPIFFVERRRNTELSDEFRLRFGTVQRLALPDPGHPNAERALTDALAGESAPPVPRRRWPYLALAVPVVAVGIVVWLVVSRPTERWSMQNIEFVVDASGSAQDTIEGESGPITKATAIEEALAEKVDRKLGASMALRTFGSGGAGECDGTQLDVGFERDNGDRIVDAVVGVDGGGPANLFQAVALALQDLQVPIDDLPSPLATRKVIIFLAAETTCDDGGEPLRREIEELATDGVDLELRVVALDLGAAAGDIEGIFSDVCDVSCAVQFANVSTTQQLDQVVTELLEVEPLIELAEAISDSNQQASDASRAAVAAVNDLDPDGFENNVTEAERALDESAPAFDGALDRIAAENDDGQYDALVEQARLAREAFRDWIEVLAGLDDVVSDRADDPDDADTLDRWNEEVDQANEAVSESNRLQREFFDGVDTLIEEMRAR
jgi:hypothetical protein